MKQLYAIIILIFLFAGYAKSQETHGTQQSVTTQDEVNSSINIDIAKIKLPPLSVLYENARSTPSIEILEKEKQLQKKLLAKEKRSWMSLFNAFGNVSHGIADNIGSFNLSLYGNRTDFVECGRFCHTTARNVIRPTWQNKTTTHSGRYRRIEKTTGI